MNLTTILKIFAGILTTGCFFAGMCAYANGLDDPGQNLLFLSAVLCTAIISIFAFFQASKGTAITMGLLAVGVGIFWMVTVEGRTKPVVTGCREIGGGLYVLADTNMSCSPLSKETGTFSCVKWERKISRYDHCGCGRRFLEHYAETTTLEDWQRRVRREQNARNALVNSID